VRRRSLVRPGSALLLLVVVALAGAQPYAADGGFDRPRELVAQQQRPALALAIDRGEPVVVRIDRGSVVRLPLTPRHDGLSAEATELATGQTHWDVFAAGSRDGAADAVYAWYHRDFTTGRYLYAWQTGGETRPLFEATQVHALRLVVGPDGPEAWITRAEPGGSRIERRRWADGADAPEQVVLTSDLGLAELDVGYDAGGAVHLAFLEGFTESTEFGLNVEWSARTVQLDGVRNRVVDLGVAAAPPSPVVIAPDERRVVWTDGTGRLVAAEVGAADAPGGPIVLGSGRPVGVTPAHLLWTDGATIAARSRPLDAGTTVNAAWSPLGIERAFAVQDGGGVTHLVWAGRRAGSGYALYASDDRTPMTRTLADRLAAAFGWSPWSLAEEAAGQAMGALLAGTVLTMGLVPVFWVLAALTVGRLPHERTRTAGALAAAGLIALALALLVAVAALPAERARALTGLPWVAPVALALGVLAGTRGLRRLDLESLQTLVLAASVTSFVALTVLAFATFGHWLALVGL
jgi:hypothetical protein